MRGFCVYFHCGSKEGSSRSGSKITQQQNPMQTNSLPRGKAMKIAIHIEIHTSISRILESFYIPLALSTFNDSKSKTQNAQQCTANGQRPRHQEVLLSTGVAVPSGHCALRRYRGDRWAKSRTKWTLHRLTLGNTFSKKPLFLFSHSQAESTVR